MKKKLLGTRRLNMLFLAYQCLTTHNNQFLLNFPPLNMLHVYKCNILTSESPNPIFSFWKTSNTEVFLFNSAGYLSF